MRSHCLSSGREGWKRTPPLTSVNVGFPHPLGVCQSVMKPLPTVSKKWGFVWTVLERNENFALLKQSDENVSEGSFDTFNVIKILKTKDCEIGGNLIPAMEKIPADSQWGIYAWNFGRNFKLAKQKYLEKCQS